jgi:cytosine deaminase
MPSHPHPLANRLVLKNATVPVALVDGPTGRSDDDGLARADIFLVDGSIERTAAPGHSDHYSIIECSGDIVFPCFVDMHTHIDKGHIWPRRPNPDGSFDGALDAVRADRAANWSAEDVRRRMEFSLRCAYAHGTALIRTHIDSEPPQHRISWPVFSEMREEWAGRIELQGVSILGIEFFLDPAIADDIVTTVTRHKAVLGAVTYMIPELERALEIVFRRAAEVGLDLDFHVDECGDPSVCSLRLIADIALRTHFPGRIVVGHTCSLAIQPPDEVEATLARVAEAGIAAVSLPMCNLYLQDRVAGRTPRWRGVTVLHEMRARGIPVAVASDNTRDPFFPYGDLDMLEVFREAVRILHLDHPVAPWPDVVTSSPAAIIGRPDHGRIAPGRPADLVFFHARDWTELFARPQSDRWVLRAGQEIDQTLPRYCELDDLVRLAKARERLA